MSEENPRAAIGLDAAHNGSTKGLRRFADFVQRELFAISVTSGMPLEIKQRVSVLSRETECLVQFLDGYLAAKDEGIQ